jgi:Rieske Fe-S protein
VGAAGAAALLLPAGCSGGADQSPADGGPGDAGSGDDASDASDASEGGACQATCATGGKVFTLTFAKYPQLQKVGGSVTVTVSSYTDPSCGGDQVIVAQTSAGHFVAFSSLCTHACCPVSFTGKEFTCPCHGSTFNLTGQVTGGPAPTALPSLKVCSDACGVYLTIP